MLRKFKALASNWFSIGAFTINLVPFLLFLLLMDNQHDLLSGVMPFAIFYSFRRTTLFIFRGNPEQENFFGKFGAGSALLGYFLGMFGQLSPLFWDLSAVGAGIGAACFPSVQKRFALKHRQRGDSHNNGWLTLGCLICLLVIIGLTTKTYPAIAFLIMIIYASLGLLGFLWEPQRQVNPTPIKIRIPNLILSLLLFCSVMLVRIGRSLGIGEPANWGIFILGVILLIIILDIFIGPHHAHHMSASIRLRMMVFGICSDFCSVFSAIYIGVNYGVRQYLWIFAAYLLAAIFGQPLINWLQRHSSLESLDLCLLGISGGLLITFIYPIYTVGIFLIRVFASNIQKQSLSDYQQQVQYQHDNVYMINYRLVSLAGLLVQFIMWISLAVSLNLMNKHSLSPLLAAYAFHQPTKAFFMPILITHIILVVFMTSFFIRTSWLNHQEQSN